MCISKSNSVYSTGAHKRRRDQCLVEPNEQHRGDGQKSVTSFGGGGPNAHKFLLPLILHTRMQVCFAS